MNTRLCLLLFVFLILSFSQVKAQNNCGLNKPIKVNEFHGIILFEHQLNLFSLKNASISVSDRKNVSAENEIMPDERGFFVIKNLKTGKYYLSIDSFVGDVSDLEFEIIPKNEKTNVQNQIEIILTGLEKPCKIKTTKTFDDRKLAGSNAIREWESISEITFERKGCYGKCPRDKITLQKDGTAIYIGAANVQKIGMFKGKFDYGFEKLAELIYRQGFFSMKERYEIPFTDLMTEVFTVKRNGKSKSVENYGDAAPVELWAIELVIEKLFKEINWKPYLPKSELKNIDLRRIARIAPKGRVQDKRYNKIVAIDVLTAVGKDSIPFLIDKLDDETKIKHHVMDYWYSVSVSDVALVILTNFFLDKSWRLSTIPGLTWDEFLERGDDKDSTGEGILRKYIAKHGRKKIKERWQKIWEENKDKIYWDNDEKCFKLKK